MKNYISHNAIKEATSKGPILIQDDVWIGYGAVILSGVTVGKGAVVGARSVVTKDIPPYAIYAGNRILGYRFSETVIEKIKDINLSQISLKDIEANLDSYYIHLTEDNVEEIIDTARIT